MIEMPKPSGGQCATDEAGGSGTSLRELPCEARVGPAQLVTPWDSHMWTAAGAAAMPAPRQSLQRWRDTTVLSTLSISKHRQQPGSVDLAETIPWNLRYRLQFFRQLVVG
jgi:hypothetical protein